MTAFYTGLAATALRLIQDKGKQLPIRRIVSTFNPVTGATSAPVTTTGTIDCVNLPASKGTIEAFDNRLFENLAIQNIRFLLVAASSATFEPRATDEIDMDGVTYSVLGVTPLRPATTPLIYKLAMSNK